MKTVLIIILVVIVLFRVLNSIVFRTVSKTVNDRMNEQMRNQQPPKPDGKITIEQTTPVKNKNGYNDDGDYTAYEEVK